MLRALCTCVAFVAALVIAPPCTADLLGVYGQNEAKFLGRIDRDTGQVQTLSVLGTNVQSLTFDGHDVYAVENISFEFLRLLRINPQTGAPSLVGTLNISNTIITGMTYDSARDTMWAIGVGGHLYQVDRQNAQATLVETSPTFSGSAMTYDPVRDSLLIALGSTIESYDIESGLSESIGTLAFQPYGMTYDAAASEIVMVGSMGGGNDVVGAFSPSDLAKTSEVIDLSQNFFSAVALVPAPPGLALLAVIMVSGVRGAGRRRAC